MKIKVYGTNWCPGSRRAKKLLTENGVPFEWINIDEDPGGCEYVMKINRGNRSVPTILFPDGEILVEPSSAVLLEKLRQMGVGS
jgi:mycoredoxin